MLTGSEANDNKRSALRLQGRSVRREKRLWHDPKQPIESLGCHNCLDREICGGLRPAKPIFDCITAFCCGDPEGCGLVCPKSRGFAKRIQEVDALEIDNIPKSPACSVGPIADFAPLIYHNSSREEAFDADLVAVPLGMMVDRKTDRPRFNDPHDLRKKFGIGQRARLLLSGTDKDPVIERLWGLEREGRRALARNLRDLGVAMVTTPNFSLFTNRPRWDDLHSVKRIAITYHEFASEGVPTALHVNGRTEHDFARWSKFIQDHAEVTHIAYEFTTGTGWVGRRKQHAAWLIELANDVGRPLGLVVRGGAEMLVELREAYANVTFIDTSVFLKTIKRQRAVPAGNTHLKWVPAPTLRGQPLDRLMEDNFDTVRAWISASEPALVRSVPAG